jgi:hypothetical protein
MCTHKSSCKSKQTRNPVMSGITEKLAWKEMEKIKEKEEGKGGRKRKENY